MIIQQYVENGERIKHYSDSNYKIRQIETGIIYEDAVDIIPCKYTYEETDELIEQVTLDNNSELDHLI